MRAARHEHEGAGHRVAHGLLERGHLGRHAPRVLDRHERLRHARHDRGQPRGEREARRGRPDLREREARSRLRLGVARRRLVGELLQRLPWRREVRKLRPAVPPGRLLLLPRLAKAPARLEAGRRLHRRLYLQERDHVPKHVVHPEGALELLTAERATRRADHRVSQAVSAEVVPTRRRDGLAQQLCARAGSQRVRPTPDPGSNKGSKDPALVQKLLKGGHCGRNGVWRRLPRQIPHLNPRLCSVLSTHELRCAYFFA